MSHNPDPKFNRSNTDEQEQPSLILHLAEDFSPVVESGGESSGTTPQATKTGIKLIRYKFQKKKS